MARWQLKMAFLQTLARRRAGGKNQTPNVPACPPAYVNFAKSSCHLKAFFDILRQKNDNDNEDENLSYITVWRVQNNNCWLIIRLLLIERDAHQAEASAVNCCLIIPFDPCSDKNLSVFRENPLCVQRRNNKFRVLW